MTVPDLNALVSYARRSGLKSLSTWPEQVVRDYLAFHVERGSLAAVTDDAGKVIGLAVGWQVDVSVGGPQLEYHWRITDPKGNAFYFAQAAAETGDAFRLLIRIFEARIPGWRSLLLFARRRGILRRFTPRYIERLTRIATGHTPHES